jgi:hypothetical protein
MIRDLFHHLLEQYAQIGVLSEIGRRDVLHTIGMSGKLITFPKPGALRIIRIVNCDGFAPHSCA